MNHRFHGILQSHMCADLLLLGGGHANLPLIARTAEIVALGHRVTCLSLAPSHYYSGMGPGMLGGAYTPEQIRFPIRRMIEDGGGTFVQARAIAIDANERTVGLQDGSVIGYDVLCVNTGSTIAPTVQIDPSADGPGCPTVFRAKPIDQMIGLRACLRERSGSGQTLVTVVGGGPAAVEIAGNLSRNAREWGGIRVQLIAGRQVLPGFPASAEARVVAALAELDVEVTLSERVERVSADGITVGGVTRPADVVVLATGVVPSRIFADSHLPVGPDGSLAVNEYLHSLAHREIFGGGDCVWYTPRRLPRAGVFAVRQGPVLVHNVIATLGAGHNARLQRFSPGGAYLLLLNLGDESALFWRRILGIHVVYRGKSAYRLKEKIDLAFMHRFGSEADRAGGADGETEQA